MKTCKDCRKFDTQRCLFNGTARATWRGCNRAEMMPSEIEKAQWWFVGWNRLWGCSYYRARNGRLKSVSRLFVLLRGQAKEATK